MAHDCKVAIGRFFKTSVCKCIREEGDRNVPHALIL